jgi:RNase P/RNase MRP subunit p30
LSYFESRLPVDINNFTEIHEKLELCEKLGIKNIILESKKNTKLIPPELKYKIRSYRKLNIFFRINLKTDKLENFKKRIKMYNNFSDVLSIESINKEVQLRAAKDSRVDIVSFSDPQIIKTLTPGLISLTKQNNSFLEFSLASIKISNKTLQSKNFRNLYRYIQLALNNKANCIISGNFDDLYDLRHPRALISICNSLLGISLEKAKKIFKINPVLLLNRKKKHVKNQFEPGVRLIKGGD